MSVVVAIKDNDRVWVGCDSQVTRSRTTKGTLTNDQNKIWKPSDDKNIVMGLVGSLRDANILSTATDWLDELAVLKNEIDYKYIVRKLVPKIFKELEEFNRVETDKGIKYFCSEVIFAYKNEVYEIEEDGTVVCTDDILATGSGYQSCLGAWRGLKDKDMSIKEKLIECVKASCEDNLYVNYPIVIMNTLNDEVEIIEKG